MKKRALLLTLMTGWYFSLILVEQFGWRNSYPLYIRFPLFGIIPHNYFWLGFWGLATLISLSLVFCGIKIVNKNYIEVKNDKGS